MSYADAAAKGPKQTPEEAAAPSPPTIIPTTSQNPHDLIDVDTPSVHSVPHDFRDRDVQTTTQADRLDREAAARDAAAAVATEKKKQDAAAARKRREALEAGRGGFFGGGVLGTGVLVLANAAVVLGVGAAAHYFGQDKGRFAPSWRTAGLGVGIAATLGVGESLLVRSFGDRH